FRGADFFRGTPFRVGGLRASLTALPAWNRTALLAAISMVSPVRGFRPSRAGRAAKGSCWQSGGSPVSNSARPFGCSVRKTGIGTVMSSPSPPSPLARRVKEQYPDTAVLLTPGPESQVRNGFPAGGSGTRTLGPPGIV